MGGERDISRLGKRNDEESILTEYVIQGLSLYWTNPKSSSSSVRTSRTTSQAMGWVRLDRKRFFI